MPKFIVIETTRYSVTAETIEQAREKFYKIMGNTAELSDDEFEALVNDIELLDGTTTFEENDAS